VHVFKLKRRLQTEMPRVYELFKHARKWEEEKNILIEMIKLKNREE
jgi:hypothetical protein